MSTKKKSPALADPTAPFSSLSPEKRKIFRFWDGSKTVAVEPLKVQRALTSLDGVDLEQDAKMLGLESPMAQEAAAAAFDRLVKAVRTVFNVPDFKEENGVETGLTDAEALQLLAQYCGYLSELKNSTAP
jgi:hypothetical protein